MKRAIKGTLILRRNGRLFEVIRTKHAGGNWWSFECKDIESRQSQVFKYEMPGMPEAFNYASSKLKSLQDILLIDLDNQSKWKMMTKEQIDKTTKSH